MQVKLCLLVVLIVGLVAPNAVAQKQPRVRLKAYTTVKAAPGARSVAREGVPSLPLFDYTVVSSRDGNTYTGTMVGQSPFEPGSGTSNVTAQIIPIIITTNSVATGESPHGVLSTTPGVTTFNPTAADNNCLSSPNNVPLNVYEQSPIFNSFDFQMGGTDVGTTQYVDAFQRANFWSLVGGTDYHVLLNATVLPALKFNIPANRGLAIPSTFFGSCGPLAIVNLVYWDRIVTGQVLPLLASRGVNLSTLPIFLFYNTVLSEGNPTNLNLCCVLGYHGATENAQTYSPQDFDTSGLFGPTIHDTSIAAHEVAEWMNDPFGDNPVPAWGHIGQQPGCQGNLEVGDPLTGTNFPDVVGTNGFTYHLQELVFFSWFYGAPSIAVDGWFSDNNTFTSDAGPVCQ